MADSRAFTEHGRSIELIGLGSRAEAITGAAAVAGAMVEARVAAARTALETWHGTHAATFAAAFNELLRRAVGLHLALRTRAAHLANFPHALTTSGSIGYGAGAHATTPLAAPTARGTTAAQPSALRRYTEHSIGLGTQLPALAASVHLDGVVGSVAQPRPLNSIERDAQQAAGAPAWVVDQQIVVDRRPLAPHEIASLVVLRGVHPDVGAVLTAARGLEAFTAAVAAAIEAADVGLLDALAGVSAPAGDLRSATADALVTRLRGSRPAAEDAPALLAVLTRLVQDDPAMAASIVRGLAPDGLASLVAVSADGYDADLADAAIEEVLEPLSAIVAAGTDAMGDAEAAALAAALDPVTLALLVSTAAHSEAFLAVAAPRLHQPHPPELLPIAGRLFGGDLAAAGLIGLGRSPDAAVAVLEADEVLALEIATRSYSDGGHRSAQLLANLYHHRVLSDLARDPTATDSLDASARALARYIERGDRFTAPAHVAMAEIAAVHLEPMAAIAGSEPQGGAWAGVQRSELVDFYARVLRAGEAREATAKGFAHFASLTFHRATAEAVPDGPFRVNVEANQVQELSRLFADATARGGEREQQRIDMWVAAAETIGATAGRVNLAVSGVTGGAAAVASGALALFTSALGDQVPRSSTPPALVREHHQVVLRAAAVQAIASNASLAAAVITPANAQLTDPEFVQRVVAGEPGAAHEFEDLLRANQDLKEMVLALTQDAEDDLPVE